MIYSPILKADTAQRIARSAQQKIKTKTGLSVSMLLCPINLEVYKTPERMLEVIAVSLNMHPGLYRQRSRKRDIVELRFIAAMFLRIHFPDLRLIQIAGLFGGQDHTSIINGLARAHDLIHTRDERFIGKYNTALEAVNIWLDKVNNIAA